MPKSKGERSRYSLGKGHYDGGYSIGTHTEDLFDEGGPTDGGRTNETTGNVWTDGGRTDAEEVQFMGGSIVNVFGLNVGEENFDNDEFTDAWLRAHEDSNLVNEEDRVVDDPDEYIA